MSLAGKRLNTAHDDQGYRDRLAASDDLERDPEDRPNRRSSLDGDGRSYGQTRVRKSSMALLQAFDVGDMPGFLIAWAVIVSKPLSRRRAPSALAQEARVVEFLACVHCAVLPFRAASLAGAAGPREASVLCAKSMSSFRRYLDRAPVPLAHDSDVVSYFALPHVPDPSTHPAFEPLFEDGWPVGLRTRIETLTEAVSRWRRSKPLLVRLLLEQDGPAAAHDTEVELNLRPSECEITSSSSFPNPPGLLSTGSQLRNTLNIEGDGKGKGNPEDRREGLPLHGKNEVGDESYHGPSDVSGRARLDGMATGTTAGGSGTGSYDDGDVGGSVEGPGGKQQQHRQRLLRSDSNRAIFGRVDYSAVKRDLRGLAEEVREGKVDDEDRDSVGPQGGVDKAVGTAAINAALLLQTIRWRFCRAPAGKTRRGVLYHLIRNDIFDLRPVQVGGEGRRGIEPLLEVLLCLGSPPPSPPSSPPSRGGTRMDPSETDASPAELLPAANTHKAQEDAGRWEQYGGSPGRLVAEYTARLLSVLVSMNKARSYILGERCEHTIGMLVETLRKEKFKETGLAKGLLEVFVRLSRRQSAQEAIASSGFVEWAAKMLGSSFSQETGKGPSSLSLWRVTEILANVFAAAPGKAAAIVAAPDMVGSFGNLLEHEDAQVQSNVVRCLAFLLGDREARDRALATGMDALLQDLVSRRRSSHEGYYFEPDVEALLDLLGGTSASDVNEAGDGDHCHRQIRMENQRGENDGTGDEDAEDFHCISDDESDEASVVTYFVQATNASCGEELLRERYRLSTAKAKEGCAFASLGDVPWGGDEEELVCGGYKTRTSGCHGIGQSKFDGNESLQMPTPEAGTATLVRGEEKVYDDRRPGLPDEMQSRPRIPRTPAKSTKQFREDRRRQSIGATEGTK